MKANTARRYRLYPTRGQAARLVEWQHTCRAVWNTALAQRIWAYRSPNSTTLRAGAQCGELTEARREWDWLADLPAQCAQQVLSNLDRAYDNFFNPDHPAGFPRFKGKNHAHRVGITFPGQAITVQRVSRRWGQVRVPKLGVITFRWSRDLGGQVRNCTISRDGLGWHVALGIHEQPTEVPVNTGRPVGVDMGIACSVYVSGETSERQMPVTLTPDEQHRLNELERRKARQLTWAKKHNGGRYSNRLRRTLAEIAKLKARQARRRLDWNHTLTASLANSHSLVAIEDLSVRNMSRSSKGTTAAPGSNVQQKSGLNRSIADQGWFERRRQLAYKCPKSGSQLVVVPTAGTSQTCNQCHTRDPESRPGCGRIFACAHCGHTEHADHNASLTIVGRATSTAGQAGPDTNGSVRSQSTRSPQRGARGRTRGTRMREPSPSATAPRP